MKIDEIGKMYGINTEEFASFVAKNKLEYKYGYVSGFNIDDEKVEEYINLFLDYQNKSELERNQALEKKENAIQEENIKKRAMAEMLITSGFHFDGYKIVKYSGYISGDDAISVDRGVAGVLINTAKNVQSELMDSLKKIRRNALHELKEAAYDLGCNAVIGVDFDYINLDPQTANWNGGTTYLPYVFGVTANGNAVIIEKIEDDD